MAHGDYDCCACCDIKLAYSGYASATKEEICVDCLKKLHSHGAMVYTGKELIEWIKANPTTAKGILDKCGYEECWYGNDVDEAVEALGGG